MNQRRLEEAVARATGEPLNVIRRRGFGLAHAPADTFDREAASQPPRILDWDQVDAARRRLFP
jgi:hypothetical protein